MIKTKKVNFNDTLQINNSNNLKIIKLLFKIYFRYILQNKVVFSKLIF